MKTKLILRTISLLFLMASLLIIYSCSKKANENLSDEQKAQQDMNKDSSSIDQKDLTVSESGAVLLSDAGRKTVVSAYQKRKQDSIVHPFVGEEMHVGIVLQTQPVLLARHIRGDIDGYPAFIWK